MNSCPLQDVAEVRGGTSVPREGTGAKYVLARHLGSARLDPSDFEDGRAPVRVPPSSAVAVGDILVALRGPANVAALVGQEHLLDKPVFTSAEVATVRVIKPYVLPEYLAAWLNLPTTQNQLREYRMGSAVQRLSLKALDAFSIPLPPLERQHLLATLASAAAEEEALIEQIRDARRHVSNELFRRTAEERPVPGCSPARD